MSVLLHRCSNQSAVIVVIWADFNIVTCLLLNTSLHYDLVYMGFYYLDTYFMSLPQVLGGCQLLRSGSFLWVATHPVVQKRMKGLVAVQAGSV
jgi:hypothetical protein